MLIAFIILVIVFILLVIVEQRRKNSRLKENVTKLDTKDLEEYFKFLMVKRKATPLSDVAFSLSFLVL